MCECYGIWGECTTGGSLAATLGTLNPFRFKGYQYDEETGWYYLQSRYYDPETGRYLSADSLTSTGQGILGYNMYAYCLNAPVNNYDPSGSFSFSNIMSGTGLLIIGILAVCTAVTVASCGTAAPVMVAVAAATVVAGGFTIANGLAEVQQGMTTTDEDPDGQNFMRDGYCGGNTETYETQKAVFQATAEAGTIILNCYMAIHGPCCFTAGTMVLTDEGPVPVEEIETGDMVYASDPFTGEEGCREVTQTFENETGSLVELTVNGETVITTETHPFYVPAKGWTEAAKLRAGDILVTVNGKYAVLEQVSHEITESPVKVYNFEVEGLHTYYVGADESDPGSFALVHNTCPNNMSPHNARRKGAFRKAKSDLGIPYGQQPQNVLPNFNRQGKRIPGRVYVFGKEKLYETIAWDTFFRMGSL